MSERSMLESLRAHLPAERVDSIIQRFRSESASLAEALVDVADDPHVLGRSVHKLRGKALVVGADELASLCEVLERDPGAADRRTQIDRIIAEVSRLSRELA